MISNGYVSVFDKKVFWSCGSRLFSSQVVVTCDRLTVDGIVANDWLILDESESDWKSHAFAIAQSICLIKKRLKVYVCVTDFNLCCLILCKVVDFEC